MNKLLDHNVWEILGKTKRNIYFNLYKIQPHMSQYGHFNMTSNRYFMSDSILYKYQIYIKSMETLNVIRKKQTLQNSVYGTPQYLNPKKYNVLIFVLNINVYKLEIF